MIHLYRYLAALTVLLVLCSTYALAVAPWFEPPPIVKATTTDEPIPPPQMSAGVEQELERLFPPDAWQRKEPKVVETEQCTLLIQDYKRLPDGGLELKPCTLIFHSSRSAGPAAGNSETVSRGRPIVLDAPKAVLHFDKPLDLAKATFGRVEKGTLSGEITIYSPPTTPTSRDELRVRTRGVWLDRQSIRTANDVDFQYGDSTGRGRDLDITLLQEQPGQPRAAKPKVGGIQTVTLKHLQYLRLATAGRGLLADAIPADGKAAADTAAPIEVTCQGEFTFDVPAQLARFAEQVEVRRLIAGGPPDRLRCDELLLAFAPPNTTTVVAATPDDPLAGRLQRIIAIGRPAVLQAPSSGLHAEAAQMEYSLEDRFVTLKPNDQRQIKQVSLRQHDQHCIAREVHYKMADEGRLGRLQAKGPGELRLLQGRGPAQQIVTARWERELLIQPQERNHVISLLDAASVTIDPLGRFDGNELHLWVLEVPAENAEGKGEPIAEPPGGSRLPLAKSEPKPKTTLIPDRLLGIGKVRVISPQLDADTSRLEAWFIHLPPDPTKRPPLAPPGPIREPSLVQPASFSPSVPPQATIENVIRPPNLQKFRVGGGLIQMQLVVRGPQFDLENLSIRGHAEIDETRTPEPGQEPLRVRGDTLEVRQGTTPEATIDVNGHPAEVAARGMSLAGGNIHVHRGKNEVTIPGPGKATLPASEGSGFRVQGSGGGGQEPGNSRQRADAPPQKMHIVWQQGLMFDGQKARFDGGVEIRTATQTALAPVLEATLSRRIDFQVMGGQPKAELARVFLEGGMAGVYVENRAVNEFGEQVSHEQGKTRNLLVDLLAGTLHADGPGWVSSVRKGSGFGVQGAGEGGRGSGVGGPSIADPSLATGGQPQPLTSVHVAFERAIEGDLAKRQIVFHQQVNTTYSPALDFNDVIAADPLANLPAQVVLMQSDALTVTEFIQPAARWFEMLATGHTKVRGIQADVDAPIIGYSSGNETLTLRGDGRAKAKIWRTQVPGQSPDWAELEQVRYNLRTGELKTEGLSNLHFNLGPEAKLNLPSMPDPMKPRSKPASRGAPP